jgi:uncharacterized membrane protein YkoI
MSRDAELLIHRHLEGLLTADEAKELSEAVRADPAVRGLLARMAFDHVALREALRPVVIEPERRAAGPAAAWRMPRWPLAAAAAFLIVSLGAVLFLREGTPPFGKVLAGRVTVEGRETDRVAAGARVIVAGEAAALVRFRDGSTIQLCPGSAAVLKGTTENPVLELEQGSASVTACGAGEIRLTSAAGSVGTRRGSFVGVLQSDKEMLVTVTEGVVTVIEHGESVTLNAGQNRSLHALPMMTLAEAIARAEVLQPGIAIEAALNDEGGSYTVEIALERGTVKVRVDARTGRELHRSPDNDGGSEGVREMKLSLRRAVELALEAVPGRAIEADAEEEDLQYEVKIQAGGQIWEVEVDGRTGRILEKKVDR